MRSLPTLLVLALATCAKVPAGSEEPTSGSTPDAQQPEHESSIETSEQDEPGASAEPATIDIEIAGIGACSESEDCQWISAPYRSADDLRQDSSGCCAMACQRPNMVVSKALLTQAATAAETVCADHRSGKATCPPMSPCRSTEPRTYEIEPLCEAGQCSGRAVPIE